MKGKLLTQHDSLSILEGLSLDQRIVYNENGNRSRKAGPFLKKLEKISPQFGVTRLANISHFSSLDFPVFQSCRPELIGHTRLGQNSGSQGKGITKKQAQISCLMETLESFSMEPHLPHLVRSSYNFLKKSQFAVDPRVFKNTTLNGKPNLNTKMMWAEALDFKNKARVLIPAELIYFPFIPQKYHTDHYFEQGSNGIAAGSNYLEACIHALYELIERHYTKFLYDNSAVVDMIDLSDNKIEFVQKLIEKNSTNLKIEIFSARLKNMKSKNLPYVFSMLEIDGISVLGFGCSATLDISISRAVSEALQGYATYISGSREDINPSDFSSEDQSESTNNSQIPISPTIRLNQLRKKIADMRFDSLKNEFDFIIKWLEKNGYSSIYFSNLTRHGIGIPVVKAIVPGLYNGESIPGSVTWPNTYPEFLQFKMEPKI